MKYRFDHIHLVSSDLEASERFYREMLGAQTTERAETDGVLSAVRMKLSGVNLFIRPGRPNEQVVGDGKETRYSYDHFGVIVEDLNAAIGELRGKGVKVLMEPANFRPGTRIAFVEGPDRTRIEVVQRD